MMENRSAPPGPIVPRLIYEDVAQAIEWLSGAFDFSERLRALRLRRTARFIMPQNVSGYGLHHLDWASAEVKRPEAPNLGAFIPSLLVRVADM